jgi:hypothetical protein
MRFPADELSKRVTEFQVVERPDGVLAGAVGMQIAERQGLIHSEVFADFSVADQLRPLLWDRLLSLGTNVGLIRVWTRETAPFWRQCGLAQADAELMSKFPKAWRTPLPGPKPGSPGTAERIEPPEGWLTLKLREDVEVVISMDAQLAMFMEAERKSTERTLQQARLLKTLATIIAFAALALAIGAAIYLLQKNPNILRR